MAASRSARTGCTIRPYIRIRHYGVPTACGRKIKTDQSAPFELLSCVRTPHGSHRPGVTVRARPPHFPELEW